MGNKSEELAEDHSDAGDANETAGMLNCPTPDGEVTWEQEAGEEMQNDIEKYLLYRGRYIRCVHH